MSSAASRRRGNGNADCSGSHRRTRRGLLLTPRGACRSGCRGSPTSATWFWWDARVTGERELVAEYVVYDWPAPTGSMIWLWRASGAADIQVF